jgi:hypothetical protein
MRRGAHRNADAATNLNANINGDANGDPLRRSQL